MNKQIDLSQLWDVFKRSFAAMIILGILGMVGAYFGAKAFIAPKYESDTSLLVNRKQQEDPNMQLNAQQADIQIISTYKDIITRPVVLQQVASDLTSPQRVLVKKAKKAVYGTRYNSLTGVQERYVKEEAQPAQYKLRPARYSNLSEEDLSKMVSVSTQQNSQVFTVSVKDTNPVRAKDIANEIAKVFEKKIATIMSVSNVSVVSKATANPSPVSPKLKIVAFIGLAVGIIIAFIWGLVRELTDQTIKNIDFITDDLGLVNLGIVSYVQHMRSMDEAIQAQKKTDSEDDVIEDPNLSGFPQRSRRRV
ncbi:Wzz/FepE/Etk N-terminal domain-containing protein [Lacticaseibacillus styriensis]|uniref:Capsular polysaccharide biosynthesis protein CpsC n=2 Tax=Lacticaseibacillus TaxID=2759736 RepID=A0AAN1KEN4_LACCA|nr:MULTISPECIES: Wzz/FepE/Etk N-terminal domain-containing protein [Lacticaseibacillus]ARY92017.1 capsular biosynthesis protein [Lacticaseibacillus casei]WLV79919.1 Wzz/FepE/Etk N-terminal domain-containing protein [Lacticaseibacillus sp. NCIMB 15473]WNX26654.1 Wzz/FepE/Etk N-terminal domain-containing protein [Lacticaseibacillus casei]